MSRVFKGFIFAPIILGLLMSVYNVLFGDLEFDIRAIIFGTLIYSIFAYFFTLLLALPTYLIAKKIVGEKSISYSVTSICGGILGLAVGAFLMSGVNHTASLLMFCALGFVLSNLFWYIALK